MSKPRIAILVRGRLHDELFAPQVERALRRFAEPVRFPGTEQKWPSDELKQALADADGCIGSWGKYRIGPEEIAAAPRLRIISHAAGTIRSHVAPEVFDRGIVVTSAASAIAPYVAEAVLGLAIALLRRAHMHDRAMKTERTWGDERFKPGLTLFREKVGLVGFGRVARDLVKLLRPLEAQVIAYDPFADPGMAKKMRVRLTTLQEVMSTCRVVSLHVANLPAARHMIGAEQLRIMQDGAVLINTARGALLDHDALYQELKNGRIHAALDVTDPEPLPPDSPLRDLPNIILTPHIAGPVLERRWELAMMVVKDQRLFFSGKKPIYQVTKDMLEWMA